MFLKCSVRRKDGKEHRSWSVVESQRLSRRRVVQRHMLYRGEINDSQRAAWEKPLAVFDEQHGPPVTCALFPDDRTPPVVAGVTALPVQLARLRLERPRP
ncbi:MAG: IS1634 family transposase, partial [Verrucomicrobia bacterium]|nr:IS1634 family transposase [Verrucomicrobiota bacterium]